MIGSFFPKHWLFLLLAALFLSQSCQNGRSSAAERDRTEQGRSQTDAAPNPSQNKLTGAPDHALRTLDFVLKNGEAPPGFVGGRTFQNREKQLPKADAQGKKIQYREWDVHEKEPGRNRGPERLVTGSDGSAYYTANHYKTFKKLR